MECPFHEVDPAADLFKPLIILFGHRFVAFALKKFDFSLDVRFVACYHLLMRVHVDSQGLAHCREQMLFIQL